MALTEIIPAISGEIDKVGNFPAAWEFARQARASRDFQTITADYTATLVDHVLVVSAASAAVTVTLPAVATAAGRVIVVKAKSVAGGNITIDGNASETIDGATTLVLSSLYAKATLFCDGVTWWLL
jgi:hypothetical protein